MPEFTAPKTTLLVSGRADSSPFKTHMMPKNTSPRACASEGPRLHPFEDGLECLAVEPAGSLVCMSCHPSCPGNWSFSLLFSWLVVQPCAFQVPESSSFYGVRSLKASKRTWNQLCQTFSNLHAWKSFFHPPEHWSISQPLKMRPLSTREAFLTNLGSHDNYLPLCFHHSLNLVGLII